MIAELLAENHAVTKGVTIWTAVIAGLEAVGVEGATIARWIQAFGQGDIIACGLAGPKFPGLHHCLDGRGSYLDDYGEGEDDGEKCVSDSRRKLYVLPCSCHFM